MSTSEDLLISHLCTQLAIYMQTGKYNIARPNYASITSASVAVNTGVPMSVDIGAGALLQPPVPGLAGYSVWPLRKNELVAGDILTPAVPDGQTPILTVIQNFRKQEPVAIRTDRVGTLINTISKALYSNVRYEWYRPAGAGGGIIPGIPTSPEEETRNLVFFKRAGIITGHRLIDDNGTRWRIVSLNDSGNLITAAVIVDVAG